MLRKRRLGYKNIVLFMLVICGLIMIYNLVVLIDWTLDTKQIKEENERIVEITRVEQIAEDNERELVNPPVEAKVPEQNDYWDYIKLPLTSVNLSDLKRINSDTVGYLSVAGTSINYPVVQRDNNDYYLTHSFKRKYNKAGWVFMDYRNNSGELDKNTIIYGHGRLDTTMFGSLKNILKASWVNNKENYVVRLSTFKENMLFQVFAVYSIPVETNYIRVNFESDNEYQDWLDVMIGRSNYDFGTSVNINDKILTLSTCIDSGKGRVVMHAKLIKKIVNQE